MLWKVCDRLKGAMVLCASYYFRMLAGMTYGSWLWAYKDCLPRL